MSIKVFRQVWIVTKDEDGNQLSHRIDEMIIEWPEPVYRFTRYGREEVPQRPKITAYLPFGSKDEDEVQ